MKQIDEQEINNVDLVLLDFEVELVLKSMEYYCYSANFLFQRNRKYTLKDDELKIALITDTYEHISQQLANNKNKKIKKVS